MNVRPDLVEYVAHVVSRLRLHNDNVHVTMAYVDRFCARVKVQGARLLLAALASLMVAAKFTETLDEEGHDLIPCFSHILAALGNPAGITKRHLAVYECRILDVLGWQLFTATPSSFARAYQAAGIFCQGDSVGPLLGIPPTHDEQQRVCQYTEFFCELATLRGLSCTHGISIAAAAAIAAARTIVGIHPAWSDVLALRLGHKTDTRVDECASAILHLYRTEHAASAEDDIFGEQHLFGGNRGGSDDSADEAAPVRAPSSHNEEGLPAQAAVRPVSCAFTRAASVIKDMPHVRVEGCESVDASSPTPTSCDLTEGSSQSYKSTHPRGDSDVASHRWPPVRRKRRREEDTDEATSVQCSNVVVYYDTCT